jgi:hypothetical protein
VSAPRDKRLDTMPHPTQLPAPHPTPLPALHPTLHPGRFAFCLLARGAPLPTPAPIGSFAEAEGTTVILAEEEARALGLDVRFVAEWITLGAQTALDGVGVTAAFSRALADAGIACNVIAAVHHDHLFVPAGDGERAMRALAALTPPGARDQST